MAFGVAEGAMLAMAALSAAGTAGSLFGGGGEAGSKGVSEMQEALLKNLLQQQWLTNLTPEMAGTMGSELQTLLQMLGSATPGAQLASSEQTDAYTKALQEMMRYGMQGTGHSNLSLLNQLQQQVMGSQPSGGDIAQQRDLRSMLARHAMTSQLSPEALQGQQDILRQAQHYALNPHLAWSGGPHVGRIDRVSGGSPWDTREVTPTDIGGLNDRFSGQLNRQAAAQLAAQGINSPALAAEASAQAAAPYQQQMAQFGAQQDLQAQLANQGAFEQMKSQMSSQELQAALANQGASAADIARALGIQESNIANQFRSAGMSGDLYNTLLGLPSTLGPGTASQTGEAAMIAQLLGSPLFDFSQLANLSQMTPANPYERLFQATGTVQAPGPQNLQSMLGQLYGMMQNRAQTQGVPSQQGGQDGYSPNFSGLLPLFMMLDRSTGRPNVPAGMGFSQGGPNWAGGDVPLSDWG